MFCANKISNYRSQACKESINGGITFANSSNTEAKFQPKQGIKRYTYGCVWKSGLVLRSKNFANVIHSKS